MFRMYTVNASHHILEINTCIHVSIICHERIMLVMIDLFNMAQQSKL